MSSTQNRKPNQHASLDTQKLERAERRNSRAAEKHAAATRLKEEGNALYNKKDYASAADVYSRAVRRYGNDATILSNLAQAYLQLSRFGLAEDAATRAIRKNPSMLKARYRRALARKGLKKYQYALQDLQEVEDSAEDENETKALASREINTIRSLLERGDSGGHFDFDSDGPGYGEAGYDSSIASDSSDFRHTGNGRPCRFYNHDGCTRGKTCKNSHTTDGNSVRDLLGKNVCILDILGTCGRGAKCHYSHQKDNLPEKGWWSDAHTISLLNGVVTERRVGQELTKDFIQSIYQYSIPPSTSAQTLQKPRETVNPPAPGTPFVLLVSLLPEKDVMLQKLYTHLLSGLRSKIHLTQAFNPIEIIRLLGSPHLHGVLVTDEGIVDREFRAVATGLVGYAINGGSVVLGGLLPSFVRYPDLQAFFQKAWTLPWHTSSYTGNELIANASNEVIKGNPSLPQSVEIGKALHIKGFEGTSAMYVVRPNTPEPNSEDDGDGYGYSRPVPEPESSVLHVKFGKGSMGFMGAVNSTEQGTPIVLSMLGLLDTYSPPPQAVDPTTSAASFILVIALDEQTEMLEYIHSHLLKAIRSRKQVVLVTKPKEALVQLSSENLDGVLIADAGIARPQFNAVAAKVHQFTRNGGLTVIGGLFSSFIRPPTFDIFFKEVWSLPWKTGSYTSEQFNLNPRSQLAEMYPSLPKSFSVKAVHVQGHEKNTGVYSFKDSEAVVARTKIRRGYLGYIGDVNGQVETTDIVLAMLNLL